VGLDPDDVVVVLGHPHGDVEMTLAEWMKVGPGGRPLLRPIAARSRSTGDPKPLTIIPLPYRNNATSRALIAAGDLESPWEEAQP
jgi:hypothetical protein